MPLIGRLGLRLEVYFVATHAGDRAALDGASVLGFDALGAGASGQVRALAYLGAGHASERFAAETA